MKPLFEKLGRAVAEQVDRAPQVALDDERRQFQRARLLADGAPDRRRWPVTLAFVATAAAAVLAVALLLTRDADPTPLRCTVRGGRALAAGDWVDAPESAAQVIDFSEGSTVTIERGARLRVYRLDAKQVHLAVENGRVQTNVRRGAKWTVGAGPYSVHVVGTQFAVSWTPKMRRMHVEVDQGRVRVRGAGIQAAGIEVEAGQRLDADFDSREVRLRKQAAQDQTPETKQVEGGPPVQPQAAPDVSTKRRDRAPRPKLDMSWRALAKNGRYASALQTARRAGSARLLRGLGPQDLLLLGDTARFAKDARYARRTFLALRERFPRKSAAAAAAFRLGRLAADQGDYRAAAGYFRVYLREAPAEQALRGDARGRLMVALERLGQLTAAHEQARRYLARHPRGPYAAKAKALVSDAR